MKRQVKEFLTKRVLIPVGRRKTIREVELPPSEKLVWCFIFCITALITLTIIEVVHIIYLGSFNEPVMNLISGLVGTIAGIMVGKKT